MKIDAWSHILPKPYLDRLNAVTSGPGVGILRALAANRCLSDLELRLRVMDRFPNYVQVLTPVPSENLAVALGNPALAYQLVPLANDAMAELVVKFPDRFSGFAAMLPMRDPDQALVELDRALTELGAVGVQIETNINGVPLDDPRYEAFFARMAALDRLIWVHPARTPAWPDYPTEATSKYALWQVFGWPYETTICLSRLVFAGHLERYPTLQYGSIKKNTRQRLM